MVTARGPGAFLIAATDPAAELVFVTTWRPADQNLGLACTETLLSGTLAYSTCSLNPLENEAFTKECWNELLVSRASTQPEKAVVLSSLRRWNSTPSPEGLPQQHAPT